MRIAVLSDIHDQVWNLDLALRDAAACDLLVCCGDLCSPFIVDQLARGFTREIHIVWGNNDADTWRMTAKTPRYPHVQLRGEFFEAEWDGRRIAVHHFDSVARAIARARTHDAVFFGHNHMFENRLDERTLLLNPGSIMGCRFDAESRRIDVTPTWAGYDTVTGAAAACEIHR